MGEREREEMKRGRDINAVVHTEKLLNRGEFMFMILELLKSFCASQLLFMN